MSARPVVKVSAAVLVAAALVFLVIRILGTGSPQAAESDPVAAHEANEELEQAEATVVPALDLPAPEAARESLVAEAHPVAAPAVAGIHVLRVVLEGVSEETARQATVTVTGVDARNDEWPVELQDSWRGQGLTSQFDLDPFLASVELHEELRVDELEVAVDHPEHLTEWARVTLSRDGEPKDGRVVHEVSVRLQRPTFWPEFTLAIRDAHTREHLEDIELRFSSGVGMAVWGQNGQSTLLGDGLSSPIALMGGGEAGESEVTVAGLALQPPAGESPRLVNLGGQYGGRALTHRFGPERGVIVSARAPGYAWGGITLDVSEATAPELLLVPTFTLDVRFTNVQLERYAALETVAMLCVYRLYPNGNVGWLRFEPLDEALEAEGLRLEGLEPGDYAVVVELGGGEWPKRPELAREELSLAAGEARELALVLADPPTPQERATLSGLVSFPTFGGEEEVRLELYLTDRHDHYGERARYQLSADVERSLADLEPVGGALPTWAFHLEDLPVGLYQVELWPFLKSWMIQLPTGGREGVELVIPELAEVLVESVDAWTGERIPIDEIYYRHQEALPERVHIDRRRADVEEPGRFRFWSAPGPVLIYPYNIPSELNYGRRNLDLELAPGFQSVRLELESTYSFRLEFREGGAVVDRFDQLWGEAYSAVRDTLSPVDHEGRLTNINGLGVERDESGMALVVEVSAPGLYELGFEGVGADRFLPAPPRLVDVRAGEPAAVIVELIRK
jgi:hypothetical protein